MENLPLLEYAFLTPHIDFSQYDLLLFTSKIAIKSLDSYTTEWKKIPCISIGKKTTDLLQKFGAKIFYESKSGYAKDLESELIESCKGKKILYLRGEEVHFDIAADSALDIAESLVYKTECKESRVEIGEDSILLFSSPKIVQCFLKWRGFQKGDIAVCIGESTAAIVPRGVETYVSQEKTLQGMLDLAHSLYSQ